MCHEGATLPFRDSHMYVQEETNKVDRAKSKPCICSELAVVITRGSQTVTAKSMHAALSTSCLLPICCVRSCSLINFICFSLYSLRAEKSLLQVLFHLRKQIGDFNSK
jgi:hypothetical protein